MIRTRLAPLLALVGLALGWASPARAQTGFITKDLTSATCTSNASSGCVVLPVSREGSIGVQINGTYVGTVTFEGSIDGVTFRPLALTPLNGGTQDTTTTTTGVWVGSAGGLTLIRARVSAYTSGTVSASLQSAPSGGGAGGGSTSGTIELVDGDNDPITDDPNNAIKVSIVAGAASGTTDTDDASIAAGQATVGLSLGLNQVFDGTVWRRMKGDGTDGVLVNLGTNNDVTVTGTVTVTDGAGALNTIVDSGTITTVSTVSTVTAVSDAQVQGKAASDAAVSGNPVYIGGRASAAVPTDVSADGDATPIWVLRSGAQSVQPTFAGVLAVAGNGVAGTGVQRVTLASDSTGQVAITGAALTSLQLIDDTVFADDAAFTLASSKVLAIGGMRDDALSTLTAVEGDMVPLRVSATGALHVTGAAGVSEFAEDTPHTTGALGNLGLAVRSDTASALAGDGDYIPLMVNAAGALYVTGGGGGTEYVVNAVAPADPTGTTVVMERDDALSTLTEIEGDWTNGRANARGALWVELDPTVPASVLLAAGTNNIGDVDILTFPDNEPFNVAQIAGSATGLAGAGVVGAGTQRITLASDDPAVVSLQLLDNAVSASGFNITQMNGANVTMGNGASGTGVQRVTLANDSTGIVALTTSTAQIGHLEANQSSNVAQINGVTPLMGAGNTGTGSPRVTISTDQAALTGFGIYVEDVAETAAGNLAMAGTVRRDTAASSAGASGDNATLNTDSLGRVWITGAAVEDAAETAAGILVMAGTVRRDTAASSAGTTGDNATFNTDAVGALWTNPFSQTQAATVYLTTRLSDGTNYLTASQDQTHDVAITSVTGPLEMGYASAAAPTNVSADGDAVAAWFLRNGSAVTNVAAGGTLITSTGASLNMNCTGGCSGGTQFAEDTPHVTADLVTMAGTVRQDTKGTGLGANGDIANLYVNSTGDVYTAAMGQVAHDAVGTSVNPLLVGGYASQAAPSDVSADGDATRLWVLRNGSAVTNLAVGGTLITATSTSLNTATTALSFVDDAAFTPGTTTMTPIGGTYRTARDSVNDNDGGVLAMTATRALFVSLETPLGDSVMDDTANSVVVSAAGGSLTVTGSGNFSVTGSASHDGVGTGIAPVLAGGYASAAAPTDVSADGDATRLWVLRNGSPVANLAAGGTLITATSTSLNTNVTAGTLTTVSTLTSLSQLGGVALPIEDAAETAGGVGIYAMSVRRDAAATSAGTDGDNATLNTDALGRLWVNCGTGCSGGTQYTQDAALTVATTVGGIAMGRASAAVPTDVSADNDAVMPWYLRSGAIATQPTYAGILAVAGNGVAGTGVQRVTLASDSTGTLAGVTTVTTVTTLSQLGGVALPIEDAAETAAGVGIYAMGVRRDVPASSAGTTGDNTMASYTALGAQWTSTVDPCSSMKKIHVPISQTAGTQLLTGTASNRTYICHISLVTATAQNIALVSGTGTVCATSLGPMLGGTTAATGWNFAANGGIVLGDGTGAIAQTDTDADNVCLLTSSSGQISGGLSYVVAPN